MAFSIRVRHQDLDVYDDSALPEDIVFMPPPPEGHACYLHIYIVRPLGDYVELKGFVPLCSFGLADNREVLVLGSFHPVSNETNTKIEQWLETAIAAAPEGSLQITDRPRLSVDSTRDDGHRMVWDIMVPHDRLSPAH